MTAEQTSRPGTVEELPQDRLKLVPRIGTAGIAFSVIGFLAPLSAMAGTVTLVIGYGNGLGAPLTYLVMGLLLGLFSIGYMALVRNVPRPGAFYSYISASLGKRLGLGASGISMCLYLAGMVGIWTFGSVQAQTLVHNVFDVTVPWWVFAFAFLLVIGALAFRGIDLNVRLVGFIVVVELIVIIIFNVVTLVKGGPDGYMTQSFTWSEFSSGSLSIGLLFAVCTVNGFEATAIFREEAREPRKAVPRATYIVVGGSALFYALSSWCLIVAVGKPVVADSAADPAAVFVNALTGIFGSVASNLVLVLVVTSVLASGLTITNVATRYSYSLGVDQVLPRFLDKVHPRYGTPYLSLLFVSVIAAVIIALTAITGVSPVEFYSVNSGIAIIGFEILLFAVSLSTVIYFRRHKADHESIWGTLIAPLLAVVVFGVLIGITLMNMDLVIGAPSVLTPIMSAVFIAAFVAGFGYACWAAKYKPGVFARIGRAID